MNPLMFLFNFNFVFCLGILQQRGSYSILVQEEMEPPHIQEEELLLTQDIKLHEAGM